MCLFPVEYGFPAVDGKNLGEMKEETVSAKDSDLEKITIVDMGRYLVSGTYCSRSNNRRC